MPGHQGCSNIELHIKGECGSARVFNSMTQSPIGLRNIVASNSLVHIEKSHYSVAIINLRLIGKPWHPVCRRQIRSKPSEPVLLSAPSDRYGLIHSRCLLGVLPSLRPAEVYKCSATHGTRVMSIEEELKQAIVPRQL